MDWLSQLLNKVLGTCCWLVGSSALPHVINLDNAGMGLLSDPTNRPALTSIPFIATEIIRTELQHAKHDLAVCAVMDWSRPVMGNPYSSTKSPHWNRRILHLILKTRWRLLTNIKSLDRSQRRAYVTKILRGLCPIPPWYQVQPTRGVSC